MSERLALILEWYDKTTELIAGELELVNLDPRAFRLMFDISESEPDIYGGYNIGPKQAREIERVEGCSIHLDLYDYQVEWLRVKR